MRLAFHDRRIGRVRDCDSRVLVLVSRPALKYRVNILIGIIKGVTLLLLFPALMYIYARSEIFSWKERRV